MLLRSTRGAFAAVQLGEVPAIDLRSGDGNWGVALAWVCR
jgi:hypothetical protein